MAETLVGKVPLRLRAAMTFEEDITLWGKVVAVAVGGVGLLAGLARLCRSWMLRDLENRIIALEGHMEDLKEQALLMHKQVMESSREAMQATSKVESVAERLELQGEQFEKNVDKLLASHDNIIAALQGVNAKVGDLEQRCGE